MKFKVKIGKEYPVVVVEVSDDKKKNGFRNFVIALTIVSVVALAGYSVITKDYRLFDKVAAAVVEVAKAAVSAK